MGIGFIIPHLYPGGRDTFTKNYIKALKFDYIFCLNGSSVDPNFLSLGENLKLLNFSHIHNKTGIKKICNFISELLKLRKYKKKMSN